MPWKVCGTCGGRGVVGGKQCGTCGGSGEVWRGVAQFTVSRSPDGVTVQDEHGRAITMSPDAAREWMRAGAPPFRQ